MANVIIVLILVAAVGYGIYSFIHHLRHGGGCCGEHDAPAKKVRAADTNKSHYPRRRRRGGHPQGHPRRRLPAAAHEGKGVIFRVCPGPRPSRKCGVTGKLRAGHAPPLPGGFRKRASMPGFCRDAFTIYSKLHNTS